ncbi:MAG: heavy-metal-associated domain-containing protein, partial [Armatimonadota bacterium]
METQTLDIPVVWPEYYEDCEQCLERLKEALECLHGMRSVNIQPDRRTLEVSYAKDLLTFETIRETAR